MYLLTDILLKDSSTYRLRLRMVGGRIISCFGMKYRSCVVLLEIPVDFHESVE